MSSSELDGHAHSDAPAQRLRPGARHFVHAKPLADTLDHHVGQGDVMSVQRSRDIDPDGGPARPSAHELEREVSGTAPMSLPARRRVADNDV